MSITSETKLISLTSDAGIKNNGTYLSDITFFCNGLLVPNPQIINVELILLHAEIPVSFYTINYSNSFFKFKLDTNPIQNLQVPVGNYNANSLITALLTLINDANFTITISKITGKLTFQHNKTFNIYTDNTYSIGQILGFELNQTYTSTGQNPFTLNTPYPLNLLGIKKLNILSSELSTINYSSNKGTVSLLGSIPVDQPSFGLVIYENKTNTKYKLNNFEISKIDIQIEDETHNPVNFNNINWCLLFGLIITMDLSIDVNNSLITSTIPNTEESKQKETTNNPALNDLEFLTN
jgi:hypothetical protein